MRVLFVAQALQDKSGGSSISEASIARFLLENTEATVLCRRDSIEPHFLERYGLQKTIPYDPKNLITSRFSADHWLCKLIREHDVCHINGHWRWEDRLIAEICNKYQVPYLLQPRGMLLVGHRKVFAKKNYNLLWGNKLVRGASRVIALSHFEKNQFLPYHLPQNRIEVVPNGVWDSAHDSPPNLPRQKLSDAHFLYFGRLEKRKNLILLLQAYQKYLIKGGKRSLWFVGPSEKGYERIVQRKINDLQLSRRVFIKDPVYGGDKWKSLSAAAAVIYPAYEEPFGRVPFEAVLAGTAVVVPAQSGCGEYLKRFFGEMVFSDFLVKDLTQSLILCDKREEAVADQIRKAREWVLKTLDWRVVGKRFLSIYSDLLPAEKKIAA